MHDPRRQQVIARNLERKARLVCCGALASVVLAACGGGGDSPVAEAVGAAQSSGAAPPASVVPPAQSNGSPAADVAVPAPSEGASPPANAAGSADGDEVAVSAAKGAITLNWTPPTTYEDGTPLKLTGYRIYWGEVEGHYPHSVTLSNPGLTRYVVEQLSPATWHFVATALSPEGESTFSNVFTMKVR